jgi:hypothetical protein
MEERPPTDAGRDAPRSRSPLAAFSTPDQPTPPGKPAERPARRAKAAPPVTFQPPSSARDAEPPDRPRKTSSGTGSTSPNATGRPEHYEQTTESQRRAAPRKSQPPRGNKIAPPAKATPAEPSPVPAENAPVAGSEPAPAAPASTPQPRRSELQRAKKAAPAKGAAAKPSPAKPDAAGPIGAASEAGRAGKAEPAETAVDTAPPAATPVKVPPPSLADQPTSSGSAADTTTTPVKAVKAAPTKKAARKATRPARHTAAPPDAELLNAKPVKPVPAKKSQPAHARTAKATSKGADGATAIPSQPAPAEPAAPEATPAQPAPAQPETAQPAAPEATLAEPAAARPGPAESRPQDDSTPIFVALSSESGSPTTVAPRDSAAPIMPERTEVWAKLVADPGHAPELLALAAVQTIGPRAGEWARRTREAYPTATNAGLARLATMQFTRFGSLGSIFGAIAGSYAPAALIGTAAVTHAQLILHIAAAHGLDSTDEARAIDLLVLTRVHPRREDAEAALATARQPAYEDGGMTDAAWRLGRMVAVQTGRWAATRFVNRYFPGTSLLAATLTSRSAAETVAARANTYYSQEVHAFGSSV